MIFSELNAGWCRFELGDFSGICSYIKHVPIDVLEGVLDYLKYGRCVISFDGEGPFFYLIADNYVQDVFIVTYDYEEREITTIDKSPDAVMASLYEEVANNIEEWADWLTDTPRYNEYIRKSLNKLVKEIENARRKK